MTRKLTLDLEALSVETFGTGARNGGDGTVRGFDDDSSHHCPVETDTCSYGPTYYYTCQNCEWTAGFEASCDPVNTYCGTYPEVGCPNSVGYCTAYGMLC